MTIYILYIRIIFYFYTILLYRAMSNIIFYYQINSEVSFSTYPSQIPHLGDI